MIFLTRSHAYTRLHTLFEIYWTERYTVSVVPLNNITCYATRGEGLILHSTVYLQAQQVGLS